MMHRIARPARASVRSLLLLLPFAAACASVGSFGGSPGTDQRPAQVTVRNDHWEDLTVYLERDGSQFRLGVVEGNGVRTLEVPSLYLSTGTAMYFVAKQAGRETHVRSAPFGLRPGAQARWTLSLSHLESPVIVVDDGS
jgi:hypothetical protein